MAEARRTSRLNGRKTMAAVSRSAVPTALLKTAIDRDPDAVCVMDRSTRIIAINAAWTATTGISHEQAVGRTLTDVIGGTLQLTGETFAPVLAGDEVIKTFKTPYDGRIRQVSFTPWRDETGEICGLITRHPIDDGPRQGFEGRERRLKMAMAMAKVFAYEIDFRTGEISYEPPHPYALPDARFYGFEDTLLHLPEAEREERLKGWKRHLANGGQMVSEYRRVSPGGGTLWQRTVSEAVRGLDGEAVGMAGVAQIIDDQKHAELALIAEKEAAQAANRAKSEFLANMSHEIRTPLTSVIGFADLLQTLDGLPQTARTYIQRISTAGQSLLSVINDVLDVSKLEAGQVELDPHPFDPQDCVEAVIDLLAAQAAHKGLALQCEFAPDLPSMLAADSGRIRQVLINLVGNAVKFTERGSVAVAVDYDEAQLRIAVSDTGCGVPEDAHARLFQRFSQADGSVSRRHGGAGLGLAICKGLVELMGGILGFESQPGLGSTFWFSVPARLAAPAARPETASDGEGLEAPAAHILIVDDVSANRELVRAMLTPLGHSFEEAENGADAVKAAMRSRFDLILMDLQMPGMDGLAAARAIRAAAQPNQRTPILAFSANVLAEHTEAARAAGMDDHIGKPIRPIELLTKVALWTSGARCPDAVGLHAAS
jgi:PAS domain S-box-containing protein